MRDAVRQVPPSIANSHGNAGRRDIRPTVRFADGFDASGAASIKNAP